MTAEPSPLTGSAQGAVAAWILLWLGYSSLLSAPNHIVLLFMHSCSSETSPSGFGSASCGHYDLLGVFCVGLTPTAQRLEGFGHLERGGMGSACFMNDPASDVWHQTFRLRVLGVRELLCHAGRTGRGEVSLILLCEYELFCNLPATTRN